MRHSKTVKHDIRLERTKAYYLPAQSSVSTSGAAGVDTSTVMLLQYTKDTMLQLPSWLSVLPMLCIALSAAVYLNAAIMTAQRAEGRDRPVKVERHTLMNALQQDELSSGLQQQDAIWLKSRQLPVINSIPSVPPPSLFNSLYSPGQKPCFLIVSTFLFCCHPLSSLSMGTFQWKWLVYPTTIYVILCLLQSPSLSVSVSLSSHPSLSLSPVAAQSMHNTPPRTGMYISVFVCVCVYVGGVVMCV